MPPEIAAVLQLVLNGMATGAIYALVALGLVITYKATEVLSFAHGDVLMASAFVAWGLIVGLGLSFWLAAVLTMVFAAVLGWQIDARVMRRIVGQPQFSGVMLTIAIAFMLRGLVSMLFGPESRSYPTPWTQQTTQIGALVVSDLHLVILAAALALTAMIYLFLRYSALGISIQAASQNQLAAYLSGIRVKQLTSLVWALAGAVAGI
ncbi:MAG: branched-chain amino acid ABC transporter permease, partial [Betaproteobacteria bacterium]